MFSVIRSQYGTQVLQSVRYYVSTGIRLAKQREHLTFNLRCKQLRLSTSSLSVKPLVRTAEGYQIAKQTSFRFLCARINENVRNIENLEHDIFFQKRQLEFVLEERLFQAVHQHMSRKASNISNECRSRMKRRIDFLSRRRRPSYDKQWIVNLSSRTLSPAERSILSRGLNFAPAPRRIPVSRIVAAVESG